MTRGRYHIRVTLPGVGEVVADYRDPILPRLHAVARAREAGEPPAPGDAEAVANWLDRNLAQVALCGRGECDHEP